MTSTNNKIELDLESSGDNKVNKHQSPLNITEIAPSELRPHPKNSLIYGEDEEVSDLVEYIQKSGWIKPLVCTPHMTIISGHRRWKAALALKLETLPIEIVDFQDELSELEALLLENASREKTTEQKVREAKAWFVIETEKARIRQIELAGTRPNKRKDLVANLPQGSKGKTRDHVAAKVGMKPRTYTKASKVVDTIDDLQELGNLSYKALSKVLNEQSVDAAYKLLKTPESERNDILQRIATGLAQTTTQASRQRKLEAQQKKQRNTEGGRRQEAGGRGELVEPKTSPSSESNGSLLPSTLCPLPSAFSEPMQFEEQERKQLTPGQLVEISSPQDPTLHHRLGRIATVEGEWVEVWLRNLELKVMATYRVNISEIQAIAMEKKPELMEVIARIDRLRECALDPFEIEILNLLDRPVLFTEKELNFLELLEKEHQIDQ